MSTPIYTFEVKGGGTVVDSDKGVIHGVSMITGGLEAKGHGLQVDKKTLKQIHQCAAKMGKVPVKTNHGTGVDAVNGYLHNFRIDGDKVRGDWVLLKKYPTTDHLMEMAEKMPESVGLSVAFRGDPELEDGTPVYFDQELKQHYTLQAGKRQVVTPGTKLFARCAELVSTDLVASPAANPNGMFAAGVDSGGDGMANTPSAIPVSPASSEEQVPAWAKALTEKLDDISGRLDAIEQGGDDDDADALSDEEIEAGLEDGSLIDNGDGTYSPVAQDADDEEGEGEEGEGEGEEAAEGVPAEAAAALARGDVHTYFAVLAEQAAARMVEHRFAQMAAAEQQAAEVQAFNALQAKTTKVTELAEQQKQQIIALQAENQELRRVKGIKTPSAGTENFFAAKPQSSNGQITTFEDATAHYATEFSKAAPGESKAAVQARAVQFAIQEHPDLHADYRKRLGISR